MLIQARAQILRAGRASRFARGDRDIDRGQGVLVQAKGFARDPFDAVAGDGGAEGARRDAQSQARIGFTIGQNRQSKKRIGEFGAAPLQRAKFGRLVQTLARLERQFTDR